MKKITAITLMLFAILLSSCSNSNVTQPGFEVPYVIQGQATGDDAAGLKLEVIVNNRLLSTYYPAVLTSTHFAPLNNFSVTLPTPPDTNLHNIVDNPYGNFVYFRQANISDTTVKISNLIVFKILQDSNLVGRLYKINNTSYIYKSVGYFYSTGSTTASGRYVDHNYPAGDSLVVNMDFNITPGWNVMTQRIDVMDKYVESTAYTRDSQDCNWTVSIF